MDVVDLTGTDNESEEESSHNVSSHTRADRTRSLPASDDIEVTQINHLSRAQAPRIRTRPASQSPSWENSLGHILHIPGGGPFRSQASSPSYDPAGYRSFVEVYPNIPSGILQQVYEDTSRELSRGMPVPFHYWFNRLLQRRLRHQRLLRERSRAQGFQPNQRNTISSATLRQWDPRVAPRNTVRFDSAEFDDNDDDDEDFVPDQGHGLFYDDDDSSTPEFGDYLGRFEEQMQRDTQTAINRSMALPYQRTLPTPVNATPVPKATTDGYTRKIAEDENVLCARCDVLLGEGTTIQKKEEQLRREAEQKKAEAADVAVDTVESKASNGALEEVQKIPKSQVQESPENASDRLSQSHLETNGSVGHARPHDSDQAQDFQQSPVEGSAAYERRVALAKRIFFSNCGHVYCGICVENCLNKVKNSSTCSVPGCKKRFTKRRPFTEIYL